MRKVWHMIWHRELGSTKRMQDAGPGSGILSMGYKSHDKLEQVLPGSGAREPVAVVELGVGDHVVIHDEVREIIGMLTTTDIHLD